MQRVAYGQLLMITSLLAGCATSPRPDEAQLRAELTLMARRQMVLESKIERLEARLDAYATRSAPAEPQGRVEAKPGSDSVVPGHLERVKVAPEQEADTVLREAMGLLAEDLHAGAEAVHDFADRFPRDSRAAASLHRVGTALQAQGLLPEAVVAFTRVADDYPRSAEARDAMLRLAACHRELSRAEEARELLTNLIHRYPQSSEARVARGELAKTEGDAAAAPQ